MTIPARALLGASLLSSHVGVAQAAVDGRAASARLEVTAAADCTSKADVIARVSSRSSRVHFADDPASALTVRVSFLAQQNGSIVSEVVFVKQGAKPVSRRLVAASCVQAADAAALIITITLDPSSARETPGNSGTDAATTSSGGSSDVATAERTLPGKSGQSGDSRAKAAERAQPAKSESTVAKDRTTSTADSVHWGVQAAGQILVGPAPGVMPGVAVLALAAIDRDAPLSAAVVLGLSHSWKTGVEEQGGTASFMLDAASLDACGLRFRLPVLEARFCGSALIGRLAASGSNTRNSPGTVARPFAVVGASGIVSLRLAPMLDVSTRIAAGSTLVQDSFEFAPLVFHTVSPVTFSASLGIGLRSP